MKIRAHAKINLSLDITGRREDGYHLVRMVMQALELHDMLEMDICPEAGVHLKTDRPELPADRTNLVYRAAEELLHAYHPDGGVTIRLTKRIPMAAGLAGGSTDAAATLRGINTLFSLGLSERQLQEKALLLGADIPFCLLGGTAFAEGIGEILTPLAPMPDCTLVLAKPQVDVRTAEAYRAYDRQETAYHPDTEGLVRALDGGCLADVASRLGNVLEPVTAAAHPEVTMLRQRLLDAGAAGACMSGSGPTVFGIFEEREAAEFACNVLKRETSSEVFLTHPVQNRRQA